MPFLAIGVVILGWELGVDALRINPIILPKPSSIIAYCFSTNSNLLGHTITTLYETIVGFLVGTALGIALAVALVSSDAVRRTLYPLLVWNNVIPKQAVAPLLVIWFGTGILPKVGLVVLVCFFPVVVNTADGLVNIDHELLELFRSYRCSNWIVFSKLRFPNALPFIFSGLKIGITLAVVGAVIAEFVGGTSGLGYLIMFGSFVMNTLLTFAALLILSVFGLVLFVAILVLERLAMPWRARSE
jgi:NitT/TauT family transport system permease protein